MFRFGDMYEKLNSIKKSPILGKMTPFKIIGNVYFVGTYQASSHLIDTEEGLILIDTGYADTADMVLQSIQELGFSLSDIKYIINTHWHRDHTEATERFAKLTGAKTLIGRKDAKNAEKYFHADILIDDGDSLTLGTTSIFFLHTPGHTQGTISFFFETVEDGKAYRVGSFGGAGLNTLVPDHFEFDGCREAYRNSLHRLMQERVDVFIGNHTWNNGTYEKSQKLLQTGENDFIDGQIWMDILKRYEQRLDEIIASEKEQ